MSTLKTHNLQSPDASSVNIAMAPNAGMVVTGISTFSDNVILAEQKELRLEPSGAFKLYRGAGGGGATNFIKSTFGSISVEAANAFIAKVNSNEDAIAAYANDRVDLYYNNQIKFTTTNTGAVVTGIVTATSRVSLGNNTTNAVDLEFGTNRGSAGDTLANINWKWNNTYVAQIRGMAGSDTTNKDDAHLNFYTASAGSLVERLRIESTGDVILKNNGGDNRIERDTTSGGPYLLFHNRGTGTTDSSGVYNLGGISAAGYRDVANPSIVGSIQFERQPTAGGASSGCNIVFRTGFNGTTSHTHHSEKLRLTYEGHLLPGANNQYDLGSTARGWRNVYMNDLNLSNMKGDTNDVDGTQGSWTIQEGKDDLYIINRLNGKKFKIKMEEIS